MGKKFKTHPFSNQKCLERLKAEFDKYQSLVVGFDFDNTVFDYHGNGGDYSEAIDLLRECKNIGFTLCLYTSDLDKDKTKWKAEHCKSLGIEPDFVNESPLIHGSQKPFFSILLDDRACLESAWSMLSEVVEYAKKSLI